METTEKVKIEGLSVGDWVYHDDIVFGREIAKVHRLNKDKNGETIGITVYRSDGAFGVVGYILTSPTNNDINPIPLTPEILEKNGLMRVSDEEDYEAYCCNDFLIRRSKFSCTDWWQVDVHYKQYVAHLSGYIQYVHQLQHLLTINECDKKIEL